MLNWQQKAFKYLLYGVKSSQILLPNSLTNTIENQTIGLFFYDQKVAMSPGPDPLSRSHLSDLLHHWKLNFKNRSLPCKPHKVKEKQCPNSAYFICIMHQLKIIFNLFPQSIRSQYFISNDLQTNLKGSQIPKQSRIELQGKKGHSYPRTTLGNLNQHWITTKQQLWKGKSAQTNKKTSQHMVGNHRSHIQQQYTCHVQYYACMSWQLIIR